MEERNVKKHILNLAGQLDVPFENLLKEGGFSFVETPSDELAFIFVKNWNEAWGVLDERYQVLAKGISLISLSPVENRKDFWTYGGKAILDESILQDPLSNKVARRLFFTDSAVSIDYAYENLLKAVHTCKLGQHLNLGAYLDAIAMKAHEQDFNVIHLRGFYVNALSYLAYLQKAGLCAFPVDIQYGYSEESFVLQFVVSSKKIYTEYFLANLGNDLRENPVHGLLSFCERQSDFFDVYELKNSGKLVISGIWSKKTNPQFCSHFINNIPSFAQKKLIFENPTLKVQASLPSEAELVPLELKKLPGEQILPLNEADVGLDYSKAAELLEGIDFFSESEENDKLVIKGQKPEAEAVQIIRGHKAEKEQMTVIHGSRSDSGGGSLNRRQFSVPQAIADKVDQEKWKQIRGELASLMRVMTAEGKGLEEIEEIFVERVMNELSLLKEESRVFVRGILGQMESFLVSKEMERRLVESKDLLNKEKGHIQSVKNEIQKKSDDEIRKRDTQIVKMKRIIDVMKKELLAGKKALENLTDSIKRDGALEEIQGDKAKLQEERMLLTEEAHKLDLAVKNLEGELVLKNRELSKREAQIQNLKELQTMQNERTNAMVKEYQDRIQELTQSSSSGVSKEDKESFEKLKVENQMLSSMKELSDKRIAILSETIDRIKKRGDEKFTQQIKNLTDTKIELQTQLRVYKEKEQEAEGKILGLETALDKMQRERDKWLENQHAASVDPQVVADYESRIKELKTEELSSRQQFKQAELTVKKLEQKVKFLTEQLAQAQKSNGHSVRTSSTEGSKGTDLKIKQLELVLEKSNMANTKMKDELSEKKKENIKLKTDLQTLQNQLQEAQRRIAILDKKIAA